VKSPKELREWRQKLVKGRTEYIVTGFDPVGYIGRPFHISTFGNMDELQSSTDSSGVPYWQQQIDGALRNAQWQVEKANKLAKCCK
jgi:hypothetical protein